MTNQQNTKIASSVALALLLLACFQVLKPFLYDILWGAILCIVTWPLYLRLRELSLSQNQAALSLVLLVGLLILLPLAIATGNFTDDISQILLWLEHPDTHYLTPPKWLNKIPLVGDKATEKWLILANDTERLMNLLRQYLLPTGSWLVKQSLNLASDMMHMGISIVLLFFFYRDGENVSRHITTSLQPLAGEKTARILEIVNNSLKAVVFGILGTALVQAIAAYVGFMIADVPHAFLLSTGAFFLMIIPAAGTLIWLPVSLWLLIQDQTGYAVFIAAWFLFFVGTLDNWLRPALISREVDLPFILIMLGVFGGLLAFGFIGIFLGPTLLATSYALLFDWLRQQQQSIR